MFITVVRLINERHAVKILTSPGSFVLAAGSATEATKYQSHHLSRRIRSVDWLEVTNSARLNVRCGLRWPNRRRKCRL